MPPIAPDIPPARACSSASRGLGPVFTARPIARIKVGCADQLRPFVTGEAGESYFIRAGRKSKASPVAQQVPTSQPASSTIMLPPPPATQTVTKNRPALTSSDRAAAWIGDIPIILRHLEDNIDDIDGMAGAPGTLNGSTETAVAKFQLDKGLTTSGQMDPATWAALQAAAC